MGWAIEAVRKGLQLSNFCSNNGIEVIALNPNCPQIVHKCSGESVLTEGSESDDAPLNISFVPKKTIKRKLRDSFI